MAKTCEICYYFEDDWNSWGQCWCTYFKSWTDIDYAEKCSNFKVQSSSSGSICYLTTACVQIKNLPDDCHELTMMRKLRDGYMTREGKESEIEDYYKTAPKIIAAIDAQADREKIYDVIYTEYILPSVKMMDKENEKEAYIKYKKMVKYLKHKYNIQ